MFKIILSPQACPQDDTSPTVSGEVITYRGISYDLAPLPEGGEIVIGSPFIGPVTRANGTIQATLEYKYNWKTSEDYQSTNWDDYTFTVENGICPCPIKRKPEPEPEVFAMSASAEAPPIGEASTMQQEVDHVTLKTQPFSHSAIRDFLNSCLQLGIAIEWTEGTTFIDRIWTVTGEHSELLKVAKQYQELKTAGAL